MNDVSSKFYNVTNKMDSNPNIKKFIEFNVKPGLAIDIGCGAGRDTVSLIKNNWNVIAIDKNDVFKYIDEKLNLDEKMKLKVIKSEIENIKLEKNDLVVANNSLPFCSKKYFFKVWSDIVDSIKKDGYFIGTFFGLKDSWASYRKKMNFVNKQQIFELFNQFEIIELNEFEKDSKSAAGEYKHWHIYAVIAKKLL